MLELKECRFWGIFWIDARSKASIATGFENIAQQLDLEDSPDSAVSWLQDTSHSWLLILDNADEPSINLAPYLPAGVNGSILITSRLSDCARKYSNAGKQYYEGLSKQTAMELFVKSCSLEWLSGSKHEDDARTIVVLLGCHALAIIQAGRAVSHGICKLEEYKPMFLNQRRALFKSMQDQIDSEYGDVYTTFEISARYLEGRSDQVAKDALQLLSFHAFMHFSDFPEEAFVQAWRNSKDETIFTTDQRPSDEQSIWMLNPWHRSNLPTFMRLNLDGNELDIISLRNARTQLESLSLINVDRSKFMTRLHPVTHAWSRDRLKGAKSEDAWLNALAVLSLSLNSRSTNYSLEQMLQPHIQRFSYQCIPKGRKADRGPSMAKPPSYYDKYKAFSSIHRSFYRLAHHLASASNPALAYEFLELIPINAAVARIGTLNFQQIQLLRALCATDFGNFKKAEELLHQASKPHGEISKAEDEVERNILLALAQAYTRQERRAEAAEILKRFKVVEADQRFLENLASICFELGDRKGAKHAMEQAVLMNQEQYNVDNRLRLDSECKLARMYLESGDTVEATRIFEQVMQTLEKILKPTNSKRLQTAHNLASCYYKLRRYKDSLRLARSIQGFVRTVPRFPFADENTKLIRNCLEAIELEKVSDKRKRPNEVEMETKAMWALIFTLIIGLLDLAIYR